MTQKKNEPVGRWLLLILTLPGKKASLRVRLWRTLKSSGAADLRDGVYLLPATAQAREQFEGLQKDLADNGGQSYLIDVTTRADLTGKFRSLFSRDEDYRSLLVEMADMRNHAGAQDGNSMKRMRDLRQRYHLLEEIDFFPGAMKTKCGTALGTLESEIARKQAPGEPTASRKAIPHLEKGPYRNRLWATRRQIWVDRMASAWLIRRLIDPQARFVWIREGSQKPKDSIGFDYDGADFTHTKTTVTFETLMLSFLPNAEPALRRLGHLIHFLDAGGPEFPGADGIEMILAGIRKESNNDDQVLAKASVVFDALLDQLRSEVRKSRKR